MGPTHTPQLDDADFVWTAGAVIGLLLLLPLWKTVGLPAVRTVSTPVSLGSGQSPRRLPSAADGTRLSRTSATSMDVS